MQLLKSRAGKLLIPAAIGVGALVSTAVGLTTAYGASAPAASSPSDSPTPFVQRSVPALAIGAIPRVVDGRDISLPVDRYRGSSASINTVTRSEYREAQACAARYGVVFDAAPPVVSSTPTRSDYYRLFGLTDLQAAQRYGYHPAGVQSATVDQDAISAQKSPDYDVVITGGGRGASVHGLAVPSGGCISEARAKVGDTGRDTDLLETAIGYGLSQSDLDARVVQGFAKWSACMSAAGYSYASPEQANNAPEWATAAASSKEIATATADVKCKQRTNLTGLRVAVASAWIRSFISAHASEFSSMSSRSSAQLARAESILR